MKSRSVMEIRDASLHSRAASRDKDIIDKRYRRSAPRVVKWNDNTGTTEPLTDGWYYSVCVRCQLRCINAKIADVLMFFAS